MNVTLRKYNSTRDFEPVRQFLVDNYLPDNRDGNYPRPGWEYMLAHPYFDESSVDRFGVWEDGGRIAGVVHYESVLGEAFFQIHPGYTRLKPAMLEYAEEHLAANNGDGRRCLKAWVNDFDAELESLVKSRGYRRDDTPHRPTTRLRLPSPFRPDIPLPPGFRLKSLADDNDLEKLSRVLFRGFDHGDEPPPAHIAERARQQSVPGYQKELNIVVEAPDGRFASYAGTWFVPGNDYAYIEPVCTDPDYRRRGLGRAAVLEGVRRCAELGARVAYVGSEQPFYLAMGFEKIHTCRCWTKYFNGPDEPVTGN